MLELFPSPVIAAVLAALSLIAGALLVSYAARRTVAQPLAIAVEDEVRLLIGILSDLRRLPYMASLAPSDFASGANYRIWAALLKVSDAELATLSADPDDAECAAVGAELVDRADQVHADLQRELAGAPTARVDLERLAWLSQRSVDEDLSDEDVVDAGQAVLLTGTDRTRLAGGGLVLPSHTPDSVDPALPPLRRFLSRPTRLRRVLTAAASAASGALLYGFIASAGLTGVSLWLGVAALAVLLAGSVVIALVDLDTMYVDLRVFLVSTLLAWALTVAAVGSAGMWGRLIYGVVVVAFTAVMFEGANRWFRWRRGVDAQGFGDTLIIIATAGIPPALTGDYRLGFFSVMAGLVACIVGWSVGAVRGKLTRTTPIAFGPYLAAGWVLGWVAYLFLVS